MILKKAEGKPLSRSRLSQASRLLGSAVRAALPTALPEQSWRVKKPKGKNAGENRK